MKRNTKQNRTPIGTQVMTGAVVLSMLAGSVAYAQEDIITVIPTTSTQTNVNQEPNTTQKSNVGMDIKFFDDYAYNRGYGKLEGHWAEKQIQTLLQHGGISGVPYGTGYRFEANREINTVELLSIILRLSENTPTSSGNWIDTTMEQAVALGIIPESMKSEGRLALTREKMAMILVNTEKNIRKKEVNTDFDRKKISDISKADTAYQEYIRQAYGIGLVAGDNQGYKPKNSTTRAETCAIINRLFAYSERVDNRKKEEQPVLPDQLYEALPDGSNVSEENMIFPAEGQKGPDGVIISRDKETGVLGFGNGQKGGIYLGLRYGNTESVIGVGSGAPIDLSGYDKLCYGEYEQHGDYVYWRGEWNRISGVMIRKLEKEHPNAKAGTVADINGNIIQGKKGDKNVFFYYNVEEGGWYDTIF